MAAFPVGVRVFALATMAILGGCSSTDRADPDFSTVVEDPAYQDDGPHVLVDEAHNNMHTAGGTYGPFVDLIAADGYRVSRGRKTIERPVLDTYQVLVVANALGKNERNDDPAFTESECDVIEGWVSRGGALLLITDHYPLGHAVENLARRFGVGMSKGVVEDSLHCDPQFDETHIVFTRQNEGLPEHPITTGRQNGEHVDRVLTFTGQALMVDAPSARFLRLANTASVRPAQPRVEKQGSATSVYVEYGDASPAAGMASGVAIEFGMGRVVVLGEAAMLTALLHRFDGTPVGMNVEGYDNRQLALNIMRWLTRRL